MTADLLPCPFCGNADLRPLHFRGSVFCEKCGCDGPWSPFFDGDWNTRATLTLSAALALPEVAALVEAAKGLLFAHDHGNGLEGWHNTRERLCAALAALEGRK